MGDLRYPGFDGFLGTRATLMLDVLVLAMLVVVLVLGWSIYQVRYRRRYNLHKWVQIVLALVLLIAVIVFEVDIRIHGWKDRAAGQVGGEPAAVVWYALYAHLACSMTTIILWPVVIVLAMRRFPVPPRPSAHSRLHKRLAWLATLDMLATAVTGWIFYWLAFAR